MTDQSALPRLTAGEQSLLSGPSHLAPTAVVAQVVQAAGSPPAGLEAALQAAFGRALLPAACAPVWPPPAASESIAGLVATTALALQRALGCDLAFRGVATGNGGQRLALVSYLLPSMADRALRASITLLEAGWRALEGGGDPAAALDVALAQGLRRVRQARPRMVFLLMSSLQRMGVPWRVVERLTWTLQIGQGARSTLLRSTMPGDQSHAGQQLCNDKSWTLAVLQAAGLPVPESRSVAVAEAAVAAAEAIGYPVVVKPRGGTLGKGVTVLVENAEEVRQAFELAAKETPQVLVERFVRGEPYRILVMDGTLVDVLRRATPEVTGDGRLTVADLVARMNEEPPRNTGDDVGIERFDPEESPRETERCLAAQGLALQSVPAAGQRVRLGYVPRHRFEICENVTDRIHPAVVEMALAAARALDLKTAGVDYLSPDIGRPPLAGEAAINEVNVAPWLTVHYQTSPQLDQVRTLISPRLGEAGGRIPLVALAPGVDGGLAPRLAAALGALGLLAGHADPGAAAIAGEILPRSRALRPGRQLLTDRRVEAAAIALEPEDLQQRGLPFDLCDVALLGGRTLPDSLATALARVARHAVVAPLGAEGARRTLELREGCRMVLTATASEAEGFAPPPGDWLLLRLPAALLLLREGEAEPLPLPRVPSNDPELDLALVAALLGLGFAPARLRRLLSALA